MVANAVFKGFHSLSILLARTQEQKMDIGQARLYWSDLIIDWHSQDRGFYLSELGMIAGGLKRILILSPKHNVTNDFRSVL